MLTSLYTGISGMNTNLNALTVVGNNIANVNTYGFKGSRMYFSDLFSQSMFGGSGGGLGVTMEAVTPSFTQGAFETTNNALDLAIEGNGFFVVRNEEGAPFYTRAGAFKIDKDGYIVDSNGFYLQGYPADSFGNILTTMGSLRIEASSFAPQATTSSGMVANLDASAVVPDPFDVDAADETSNFSTTVTVYDSLGNEHPVELYFRKSGENAWEWYAVINAEDAASGTREIAGQGTLAFDSDGRLQTVTGNTVTFDFAGGATLGQSITFDFGTSLDDGGTGVDGIVQYGGISSSVYNLTQDGYPPGSLQAATIDDKGILVASFTNGKQRALGQVALANFPSLAGLKAAGNMYYTESPDSGAVVIGKAGTQGFGSIRSSTLELSNVDLASEFVRMITAQRGFQASSKVITTTDEVLLDLVNLKR